MLYRDYAAIESEPGYSERSAHCRKWAVEDPIKPYAEAAFAALQALHRPVRVRDPSINAFGEVRTSNRPLTEPPVAGYACGAIGNVAPKAFAELHDRVMQWGKGNAKRGLAKILAALNNSPSSR